MQPIYNDLRIVKVENGYIVEEEVDTDRRTWVAASFYDIQDVVRQYYSKD